MNWYEMQMVAQDHLNELHGEAEMDRLAQAARGNKRLLIGLEDVRSARALVSRITARQDSPVHAPRLTLQRAHR